MRAPEHIVCLKNSVTMQRTGLVVVVLACLCLYLRVEARNERGDRYTRRALTHVDQKDYFAALEVRQWC